MFSVSKVMEDNKPAETGESNEVTGEMTAECVQQSEHGRKKGDMEEKIKGKTLMHTDKQTLMANGQYNFKMGVSQS